jgi:hypothetical protein
MHLFAGAFSGLPHCMNIPEACSCAVISSSGVPHGRKANQSTHCFNTGSLYLLKSFSSLLTVTPCLLQVHCTLLYYVTSIFEAPTHKHKSTFLKNNWDDLITQIPTSIEKQRHVSVFLSRIKKLKDEHWDDIFESALAMREQGAGNVRAEVLELPEEEEEEDDDDDDESLDPKYDIIQVPEPSDM